MRPPSFFVNAAWVLAMALILAGTARAAPKYKVLHAFGAGKDGAGLWGSLLLDQAGNVYGTTTAGGTYGGGIVFVLTPKTNGGWRETILHNFDGSDGDGPNCALIFDPAGDLYGTTPVGGGSYAHGTVFEMKPGSNGWTFAIIHRFGRNDQADGPYGGVVTDQIGNLYGVGGWGFELSPGSGGWKETLLHAFTCQHGDGCAVLDRPVLDAAGNLYGTTELGGVSKLCGSGCGTVYQLQRTFSGGWKEYILHDFGTGGDDMAFPGVGALVLDSAGRLYGTVGGGTHAHGAVYKLAPQSNGHWKAAIQHSFTGGASGDGPSGGVVIDKAGNLYGTTIAGGDPNCGCGVVYRLAPGSNGKWTYTVLHRFTGFDGAQPDANLILDDKGNLYGTTATGGTGGYGVAFELTP